MLVATLFALSLAAPAAAAASTSASDAQALVERAVRATTPEQADIRVAQSDAPPPPPLADTPPPAGAAPPSSAVPPPDEKVAPPGLDPFLTTGLQFCVGCLTGVVVGPIAGWIPFIGTLVILPAAVTLVEVFLGDFVGQKRGALIWPFLGAVASTVVGGIVFIVGGIVIGYALAGAAFAAFLAAVTTTGFNPAVIVPIILAGGAGLIIPIVVGALLYSASNALVPALVYMLTSEDKRPGDTGGGFPGFIEPGHATPNAQQVSATRRARLVPAMAY